MTFRNVASNGGFVSPPGAPRAFSLSLSPGGTGGRWEREGGQARNFRSIPLRGRTSQGEEAQICAITSDNKSIHHIAAVLSAEMRARGRGHVENLSSETPVKLAADNLYRDNLHKSEPGIESIEPDARARAENTIKRIPGSRRA